ncbi:protein O-mannosyl-transferase 2-like isoform X2 [Penaeus japonicus]|uniref:protein O-mannosyl-transferase 2-like isoform X2 n=1 Tax=Penaeus japonicus TaxID=27405 RepID=UPI001C70DC45|nr:protein O-mannosyl-transferase 2-like isoform X2 [Penaeus japonicus]
MAPDTAKKAKSSPKVPQGLPTFEKMIAKFRHGESPQVWWTVFGIICLLTAATRFYKVGEPEHVVWDETHFGKFGSWYINRTFFFDVHPPLGKMMIGAFGYLTGYDGMFPFVKPGDSYEGVNYLGMRVCCTALGACLVPFAFIIVWEMTKSLPAATLGSSLILFDIGLLTLNQYILLDPILLFFIMGSVMGMMKFLNQRDRPFSMGWWGWLVFTGVMLSGSVSVKFVGLFVVLYVGLHTIKELWDLYGDLNNSLLYVGKHFTARALGLIALPIVLYCVYFYIHLTILCKSGNGDGFYSSAFQSQLEGNSLYNASMPLELAYGAEVTLKNARTGGGYLHSHIHLYPEGSGARQQQITTYSHKDYNNKWLVKKWNEEPGDWEDDDPVELVKNGDLIRLEHVPTGRNLHSHREPAPVTKRHHQVTGYGENGIGDVNDVWRVEVINGEEEEVVKTVVHKVRFVHYLVGCSLMSHNKQLPKWGFEQMEVTCNPNVHDPNNVWNIEDNVFPKLPNTSFEIYAPNFLEKFLEAHTVMFQGNSGLKPKEGEITSQPWQWPINIKGQHFSGGNPRIYLLGNPIVFWGNLVALVAFLYLYILHSFQIKRGYYISPAVGARREKAIGACGWLALAWALHYLPFFAMGRILYFHHYFPALLFSSMLTGVILDYLLESVPNMVPPFLSVSVYHWMTGLIYSVLAYSFYIFAPLAYGMHNLEPGFENGTIQNIRWLDSWEF